MKSIRSISVFVLLLAVALCAMTAYCDNTTAPTAERPQVTDQDSQTAMHVMDVATAKAKADYDRAVANAQAAAVLKLQARLTVVTRAGNLDLAVSIKRLIEYLKPSSAAVTSSDVNKPLIYPLDLVGTWREGSGGVFVFATCGKFMYAGDQPGTWKVTVDSLTLTWANKPTMHVFTTFDQTQGVLTGPGRWIKKVQR